MGVTKSVLQEGNKTDIPKTGDLVSIQYTGNLHDPGSSDVFKRGMQFDSTGFGDFITEIDIGKVIKGWDEGVTTMSLGEKAILTITGDYAYGSDGFPGLIPPDATLVFEVYLKGINNKKV